MQVFQTASSSRWNRFKWLLRASLCLLVFGIAVIVIALWRDRQPLLPRFAKNESYKAILHPAAGFTLANKSNKTYEGFRQFIQAKYVPGKNFNQGSITELRPGFVPPSFNVTSAPARDIRAGFYVDWDPQSFFSLQRNIAHLNLVVPEWLFLDPVADTITVEIDDRAAAIINKAGVAVMPMLSNNIHEVFRGDIVHRIISDPVKKQRLISNLLSILERYHFAGINVDFEELQERGDENLVNFQKELYESLHANGFKVSQDIVPFDSDYNFAELAKYNDYVFVMAYDQFSDGTVPGPVCDQKWIEAAVDDVAAHIPSEKIVLGMAAYGYDWKKAKQLSAKTLTYQQALVTARESEGQIDFDNDSYNLHYSYYDDEDSLHEVYFTDAATTFNTMRFANESGLAGVALWRLGSEDSRTWDFFDRALDRGHLQSFDFNSFSHVHSSDDVDYNGTGEVLDVLAEPTDGEIAIQIDSSEMIISEESYNKLPSQFVVQKYGGDTSGVQRRKLVLTFDDGPDPEWTPQILDILGREHVPAAFFLVGINAENNIPLVKRIYREGHELGNHSFTHPNMAAISKNRAVLEMESTRLLLECITGHSTILFRAPFNADYEPEKMDELEPVALARTKNYLDVGESIDPLDWEPGVDADTIVTRIIRRKEELERAGVSGNIILLHDAGGKSRRATVEALPKIISYFRQKGYSFTTVADLLHKKRDDLMPAIPKNSGYYIVQLNYLLAEVGYWGGHALFSLFVIFIVVSLLRMAFMAYWAFRDERKQKYNSNIYAQSKLPFVSIIVPAYNEEVNVLSCLQSLLAIQYPAFDVVFVDDGSTDATFPKVSEAFKQDSRVRIFTKPNGGKASALNYGIAQTGADFVVCIDADTRLQPAAVAFLMQHFSDDRVGAVAGNVKVGNERNLLTRWQAIEYISSQNFDRKAFAALNAITVVPGAIGAFRKTAIEAAGGFTTDTLAEDCDLTIRILRSGYIVRNENRAIAMTEAPESVKMFVKQRFRWNFGVMQTFWKHRDALFNSRYRALGWVALPNILLFQFIIPTFAPLADFFMIIALLTGNAAKIGGYYLIFMLLEATVAFVAFRFEREKLGRLVWLIPQRLIYRWLILIVLFKSLTKAIKGELQKWGALERTGHVRDMTPVVPS